MHRATGARPVAIVEPRTRLLSLDLIKGVSITYMIFIHTGMWWLQEAWKPEFNVFYLFTEFLGPVLFIAMTVVGTMVSFERSCRKGRPYPFSDGAKKASFLVMVGLMFNILYEAIKGFPLGWWSIAAMNMFLAIAISQLVTRLCVRARLQPSLVALAAVIVLKTVGEPLMFSISGLPVAPIGIPDVNQFTLGNGFAVVFFFLFHGEPVALIDTIVITMATLVVARECASALARAKPVSKRNVVLVATGLILGSILCGGFMPSGGPGAARWSMFLMGRAWTWEVIPLVFVRHSSWNLLLKVGVVLLVLTIMYHEIDLQGRKPWIVQRLAPVGEFSLSVYVFHGLLITIPLELAPLAWILAASVVNAIIISLVHAWSGQVHGIGSLEWGMRSWVVLIDRIRERSRPGRNLVNEQETAYQARLVSRGRSGTRAGTS